MKRSIFILSVATLLMAGCNSEVEIQNPNEIRINASLGASRATLTNFEVGDKMSLYAVEYNDQSAAEVQTVGNYINNEQMTYNGTEWKSNRKLYWSVNPCDFYGFYPYQQSHHPRTSCTPSVLSYRHQYHLLLFRYLDVCTGIERNRSVSHHGQFLE